MYKWNNIYTLAQKNKLIDATLPKLEELLDMPERKDLVKTHLIQGPTYDKNSSLVLQNDGLKEKKEYLIRKTKFKFIPKEEYKYIIAVYELTPEILNERIASLKINASDYLNIYNSKSGNGF